MSECERCGAATEAPKRLTCNGRMWGVFCVDCHDLLARVATGDAGLGPDPTAEPVLDVKLTPVHGDTRRLEVGPNPDPGAPYLLTEASWTGCAWSHDGTEAVRRVEVDGEIWHEADAVDEEVVDGP